MASQLLSSNIQVLTRLHVWPKMMLRNYKVGRKLLMTVETFRALVISGRDVFDIRMIANVIERGETDYRTRAACFLDS